jgi:hypothetical protein
MNTGQTMLVIGAFTLFSTATVAINSTIISTSTLGIEMEASLNALSIAQSMLDEIMQQSFDEKTTNNKLVTTASGMTPKTGFGSDGGSETITCVDFLDPVADKFQSQSKFDDVDDYDGYKRKVLNTRLGWFEVEDSIAYVQEGSPNTVIASQTWQKRITVKITNYSLNYTLAKDGNQLVIPYYLKDIMVYREFF